MLPSTHLMNMTHFLNSSSLDIENEYSSHMMNLLSIGTPLVIIPGVFIFIMRYLGRDKRNRYFKTCTILMNAFINRGRYSPRNAPGDELSIKQNSIFEKLSTGEDVVK